MAWELVQEGEDRGNLLFIYILQLYTVQQYDSLSGHLEVLEI